MKISNLVFLISTLTMIDCRITHYNFGFPKQNRRLKDRSTLKIVNNLSSRAAKTQKSSKRKLMSGKMFGGLTGAAGLGMMYLGQDEQERQIKNLKMTLETQRMHLGREEVERNGVLNQISVHIDETFDKFDSYRSALVSKIEEFNTFIQSKLKPYGMGLTGLKVNLGK